MNEGGNSGSGNGINSEGRQRMETQVAGTGGRGFLDKFRNVKSSLSEMRRPAKPLVPTPDEKMGITRYDQVVPGKTARDTALNEIRQAISDAKPENQVIPFSDLPPAEAGVTPFSEPTSEPFHLQPVTPEKDEKYKQEASNGYTPLQNEQGQPQIDAIRAAQTKQAELDAAAQVKAKREDPILTNDQIAAREAALNTPIDAQFTPVEPQTTSPLPSEQASTPQTTPVTDVNDPGLFKLNPITSDQAAAYQKEAASGYTSQQIEQGQPKIDEIRANQSPSNIASAASPSSTESKTEHVGSLGLDQIRAHTKAATTLDERFQQGDQSITREEAQSAALNRVNQPEAPADPRDALLERLAKDGQSVSGIAEQFQRGEQVTNIFTGQPFTQTELQSLMQRQAELGAKPASIPTAEQTPIASTEAADPFTVVQKKLTSIEEKRTHVDSQDRKIRHDRDKVFKDVLANASDEVQHKLAAENPAFRERYLKAKRAELSLTPEQEVELYKQLATEGGLPRHRVVANAAERLRKLKGVAKTRSRSTQNVPTSTTTVGTVDGNDPDMFRALDTPDLLGASEAVTPQIEVQSADQNVVTSPEPASTTTGSPASESSTQFFDYALTGRRNPVMAEGGEAAVGTGKAVTTNPRVVGEHTSTPDGKGTVVQRPERSTPITVNRRVVGGAELPEVEVTEEKITRLGTIEDLAMARLRSIDEESTGEDARSRTKSSGRRKLIAAAIAIGAFGAAMGLGRGTGEGEGAAPVITSSGQGHELVVDGVGSSTDLAAAGISLGGDTAASTESQGGGTSGLNGNATSGEAAVGPVTESSSSESTTNSGGSLDQSAESGVPFTATATPNESISGTDGAYSESAPQETEYSVQTFKNGETLSDKLMQQFGNDWDNPDILVTHLLDPNNYQNFKSFYEMKTGEEYPTQDEIYQLYQRVKAGDEDSSALWHLGDYVPQDGEVPGTQDEFDIYNADGVKIEVQKLNAEANGMVANNAPSSEAGSGEAAIGGSAASGGGLNGGTLESTAAAPVGDGTGGPEPAGAPVVTNTTGTEGAVQVGGTTQTVESTAGVAQNTQSEENQQRPGLFSRLFRGRGGQNGR